MRSWYAGVSICEEPLQVETDPGLAESRALSYLRSHQMFYSRSLVVCEMPVSMLQHEENGFPYLYQHQMLQARLVPA